MIAEQRPFTPFFIAPSVPNFLQPTQIYQENVPVFDQSNPRSLEKYPRVPLVKNEVLNSLAEIVSNSQIDWSRLKKIADEKIKIHRGVMDINRFKGMLLESAFFDMLNTVALENEGVIDTFPQLKGVRLPHYFFDIEKYGNLVAYRKINGESHSEYDSVFVTHNGNRSDVAIIEIKGHNGYKPKKSPDKPGNLANAISREDINKRLHPFAELTQRFPNISGISYGVMTTVDLIDSMSPEEKAEFQGENGILIPFPISYPKFTEEAEKLLASQAA